MINDFGVLGIEILEREWEESFITYSKDLRALSQTQEYMLF